MNRTSRLLLFVLVCLPTVVQAEPEPLAAVFCRDIGGKNVLLEDRQGTPYGFCAFERAWIQDETLFALSCGGGSQAATAFLSRPKLNDFELTRSGDLCIYLSLEVRLRWYGEYDVTVCDFPDGSQMEEETLWTGAQDPRNEGLAAAIRKIQNQPKK